MEDAVVLLLDLQVKVGAVTQHDALLLHLTQQAENPEREVQDRAHLGLHGAGGEVHGNRLNNIHLRENRIIKQCKDAGKIIKSQHVGLNLGNNNNNNNNNMESHTNENGVKCN